MSTLRRGAIRICCATGASPTPETQPTHTTRPARPAIWGASRASSASLTDYANASVSWLQAQNQQASDASSYQNAVATQATSALSNATGVNLDAEMTNMLNLENSYASTAKLLTTVTSMFTALLQAA